MPSDVGQGSSVIFGTLVAKVVDIGLTANGNPVDLTALSDTKRLYGAGVPDWELNITVVGTGGATLNSTGALSISWNDGTQDTLGTYLCTNKGKSTGVGGRIESRVSFKPAKT